MLKPGDFSDTLRALGRFVELVGAFEITIDDRGEDSFDVAWQCRDGRIERHLTHQDVDALRRSALFFRGTGSWSPVFGTAGFLRSVGREMDDRGAEGITVAETLDGFWAAGTADGIGFELEFTYAELVERTQSFQRQHRMAAAIR